MVWMSAKSFSITRSMSGRMTLTATSSPLARVAAWTCANEADAMGSVSKVSNRLPMVPPRLASMRDTAMSPGNGGTWSCSLASSSA